MNVLDQGRGAMDFARRQQGQCGQHVPEISDHVGIPAISDAASGGGEMVKRSSAATASRRRHLILAATDL
jgi:hypothetical protein